MYFAFTCSPETFYSLTETVVEGLQMKIIQVFFANLIVIENSFENMQDNLHKSIGFINLN